MNDKNREEKQSALPFDPEKKMLDYPLPVDHTRMLQYLDCFREHYPFVQVQSMGSSILGRSLPAISLGEGEKTTVLIGTHQGVDWLSCVLLLRFINEYAEGYRTGQHIYNTYLPYLFHRRRILVIPMLNPDGVDYCLNGIKKDNPLYSRLVSMTASVPPSRWCGNARGIDLTHNYDIRFSEYRAAIKSGLNGKASSAFPSETPESEPEIAYLCNYLRFYKDTIGAVISLTPQGEQISYYEQASNPRAASLGKILSRLCNYPLHAIAAEEENATLLPWCAEHLGIPAYAMACGYGGAPVSLEYYFCIYAAIRQMLFEMPQLI